MFCLGPSFGAAESRKTRAGCLKMSAPKKISLTGRTRRCMIDHVIDHVSRMSLPLKLRRDHFIRACSGVFCHAAVNSYSSHPRLHEPQEPAVAPCRRGSDTPFNDWKM